MTSTRPSRRSLLLALLLLAPISAASGMAHLPSAPALATPSPSDPIGLAEATLAARTHETATDHANFALARGLLAAASATSRDPAQRAFDAADVALAARLSAAKDPWRGALSLERDDVRAARDIASLVQAGGDPLATGVAIADREMPLEAAAAGLPAPATAAIPDASSASAAANDLLARHGVTPTAAQAHAIAGLDAIPATDRVALARFVASYAAFESASDRAFSSLSPADAGALASLAAQLTDGRAPGAPELAPLARLHVDIGPVLATRSALLHATLDLRNALRSEPVSAEPVLVPPVLAINLTTGDSTYTDDYRLLLDEGGNDTYLNNAGGTGGVPTDSLPYCDPASTGAAAALVDLGGGDDRYGTPARACGVNGGGALGAGFLVDDGGNDTYQSAGLGANGGGLFGAGFLLDAGGDDHYRGPAGQGVNGGGDWGGEGSLVDLGGNDTYLGGEGSNGGGYFGAGFLVDAGGDDHYAALGGGGTNGGGTLGAGFLLDTQGNDTYDGGTYGANGGGSAGVGALVDLSGNDTYTGHDYGVNGGGSAGVGLLVDASGDDVYTGGSGAVNGGSLEAFGFLLDMSGNDRYVGNINAVNGGGSTDGVGLLFDAAGNDTYIGQGAGANGGGYIAGSSGFLFDVSGDDTYASATPPAPAAAAPGTLGVASVKVDGPGRYAVGFSTVPAGLVAGSFYGGAHVAAVEPAIGLAILDVAHPLTLVVAAAQDAGVRYVHPIVKQQMLAGVPNDARYGEQYGPQIIDAPDAWNITRGDPAQTICMVDTGVNYQHEDLQGGRFLGGINYIANNTDPWDDEGHGTHTTGIALATTNNGVGIAGVSQSDFYMAKVFDMNGAGTWADVARAMVWCTDHGARIVSMSLGAPAAEPEVKDAVQYAWAHGVLLVAAAGNAGPCYGCVWYPAAYPEVMAVACTDSSDAQCSFSSSGPEVEISAPGYAILSTYTGAPDAYTLMSGTSMSTPHVAGVASLVWSVEPNLTACQVREVLRDTATDVSTPGWDPDTGFGRVDANAAVVAAANGARPTGCSMSGFGPSEYGANGGAFSGGAGFLLDLAGNDTYISGSHGTNGGADFESVGRLIDVAGDDTYKAVDIGANGAVASAGEGGASGLLADLGGHDTYQDNQGGSGEDMTVPVKGGAGGMQVDLNLSPGA